MPNISFDIFFQEDIINITASRSGGSAPKIKPAWKVRSAPKLPPKEPPVDPKVAAFGAPKLKQPGSDSSKALSKPSTSTAKPAAKSKEAPKANDQANAAAKKPTEAKKVPKLKEQANGKAS